MSTTTTGTPTGQPTLDERREVLLAEVEAALVSGHYLIAFFYAEDGEPRHVRRFTHDFSTARFPDFVREVLVPDLSEERRRLEVAALSGPPPSPLDPGP